MATSGSTDWTLNRDQVITGALRKLGVIASGVSPSAQQTSDAAEALNAIVKAYQADGMPLWKIVSTTFTTVNGTNAYNIGVGQTINTTGKPLRLWQAIMNEVDGTEYPLNIYNRYDFQELPFNNNSGTPVNLYYQPLSNYGVIKLWPTPDDSTSTITVHYQTQFEDMDNATDDFDFPSEWIQPLIYALAWSLCPEYGIPIQDTEQLAKTAQYWHEYVLSMGTEEGSIYFQPDWTR